MSVVAGCSLLNGVLLGADCRISYRNGGGETHRDTVQKLVIATPTTSIGFVGDVATASHLLESMLKALPQRRRSDAISLGNWMVRLFRYKYAMFKGAKDVKFMVGSVVLGRPQIVERAAAARLVHRAFTSRPLGSFNGLSGRLAAILTAQTPYVILANEPMGLLYVLSAPDFRPDIVKPLEYRAIGSGEEIVVEMEAISDQIFAGMDSVHNEAMWLGAAMKHFLKNKNVPSVGGMFTMVKVGATGAMPITRRTGRIPHGPFFELAYENHRWVQRNVTTGKEIMLSLPWEIDSRDRREHVFDDLRDLRM